MLTQTLIAITLVTLIAAVILKVWLSYPKKLAPSLKEAEWTSNTGLNLSTVNMVKQPLNPLAVSRPVPPKRQVYPMGSPTRSDPIDFNDTSLLLASELASMDKYNVVDIKKPDEAQLCVQPAVEETKHHSTQSYDYGRHNSCSGYSRSSHDSGSSSSDSGSSSSSSSSGD